MQFTNHPRKRWSTLKVVLHVAVLVLLATCTGKPANPSERKDSPAARQAGRNDADVRKLLARKVLELCRLPGLRPPAAAATLESTLGPPRSVTRVRTEYSLGATQLIAGGSVAVADGWTAISLHPAPSVGLALQDLQPMLLDRPYRRELLVAHGPAGPSVKSIDHMFLVDGVALIVRLPPETDAQGTARGLVEEIVVSNSPPPTLIQAPTLRARRGGDGR